MKKIIFLLIGLLCLQLAFGQVYLERQVVASSGNSYQIGNLFMDQTLGQLATQTYFSTDSGIIVTQGFQQPEYRMNDCLNDTESPEIANCPTDIVLPNEPDTCGAHATWAIPIATDNCYVDVFTCLYDSGDFFAVGTHTAIYTVIDSSNNSEVCVFTITVEDTQLPEIHNCPADIVVSNDSGQCGASVGWAPPTATDNCGVSYLGCGVNPGAYFPVGSTTLVYTAIDNAGNHAVCVFNVTVQDTEAPAFSNCPGDIDNGCDSIATWSMPVAADNCGIASIVSTNSPGDAFPVGTTTVNTYAFDDAGNAAPCSFIINVSTPPVANAGQDVTICPGANSTLGGSPTASGGSGNYWYAWTNTAFLDSISAANPVASPVASTTFILMVMDAMTLCSAYDDVAITIESGNATFNSCPQNIVTSTSANACHAVVTWNIPLLVSDCPASTISNFDSGDVFPMGTTVVEIHAIAAGDTLDNCSFAVIVSDNEAPNVSGCPSDTVAQVNQTNCAASVTWSEPVATDNCNVASFSGSHSSGDIFTLGNTVVSYLAADDAGNSSICSFTITVEELMPPLIINCPINIVVGNAPGLCSSVVTWAPPSATDVCGVPLLTGNYAPGSTFPVGNTMVLYTATDASGLTASCNFIVTVEDTETPTITLCPDDITVVSDSGTCGANAYWQAYAWDNCGVSSFGCGSYSGDFFEAGAHTLTYTAWDAAGNFDTSCSFTITVETTSPPVFIYCPGDTVIYTKVDTCGAGFVSNAVVYSDCGANIICNIEPTELLPVGSTTVFHIAEDISGRQDSCSFNVTVVDNVAPEFENCPDTISVFDSVASWSAIQAADNCAVDTLFSTHQSGDSFPFGHTTVIYTTIDWAGNTSTCEFVVSVGVNAPLMIDTIIVSNATLIGGNDGTIDIEVSGGVAPYNCLWSTGDTTEDLSNIPAGSYYVTVWDAGGNTVSATAVVQEPDCPQPTGVTKSATDGEITINWSSSPGALTTQIQSRVKPGQNGAMADNRNSFSPAGALTKTFPYNTANCGYTYQARVRHICSADNSLKSPWKYVANIPTSCAREMEPTETRLTLFPNPVSGVLNIVLPNVEDVRSYELRTTTLIEILDITGKTIHSEEISVDAGQLWTINVNDWPEGVYLLRLTLDNKMWNKKFVVGGH